MGSNSKIVCSIGIVGGGIAGVAAAIAVARAGHHATVFEQAVELKEVGAGIEVPCNSTRILRRWGILERLQTRAIRPANLRFRSYTDGSTLYTQKLIPGLEEVHREPFLLVHRSDLLAILVDEARQLGVSIRLGVLVDSVDFERTIIHLNSSSCQVDAIICADGLKSFCRTFFPGGSDAPVPTGHLAYRLTLPTSLLHQHSNLEAIAREPNLESWIGPNAHAITYQLQSGKLFNVVFVTDDDLPASVFVTSVGADDLQIRLKNWDPRISQLFCLAPCAILKWKICTTSAPSSWVHPTGHAVLMGDAAHASLPCLGQGAASALEDAAVLGTLFAHLDDKKHIPQLLRLYEACRKPRAERLVAAAAQMRDFNHLVDGPAQQDRDAELRAAEPRPGWRNVYCDPDFQSWMFGTDVVGDVERLWKRSGDRIFD